MEERQHLKRKSKEEDSEQRSKPSTKDGRQRKRKKGVIESKDGCSTESVISEPSGLARLQPRPRDDHSVKGSRQAKRKRGIIESSDECSIESIPSANRLRKSKPAKLARVQQRSGPSSEGGMLECEKYFIESSDVSSMESVLSEKRSPVIKPSKHDQVRNKR